MKHSLKNDKGLSATKAVNQYATTKIPVTGPRKADYGPMLEGKLVSFKNAEDYNTPDLKSYNFEE